jgi:hypothetical protein
MKQYSSALLAAFNSADWQARFVVAVHMDDAITYFASHTDIVTPDPDNTIYSTFKTLSSSTQENTPSERISTIGTQSFTLADADNAISDWLRTINNSGASTYEKKTQFWIGAAGLDFDDYAPQPPQYITKIKQGTKTYSFTCRDALRFVKTDICTSVSTELTADLPEDETSSLSVTSTDDMPGTVAHGDSYSDGTAGTSVAYLYLEGEDASGNTIFEVITATGITSTGYTGLTRGALNTRAYEWEAGTEISAHVYLELPTPKLIYALLTGNLYGQTGATLPADWNNEIDESLVDLASFENIGTDLWDPTDDTAGKISRIDGLSDLDAKAFIETDLLPTINCSLVVNNEGRLALKRTEAVVTDTVADYTLNETNVFDVGDFENDLDDIVNRYLIKYSYRRDKDECTRYHLLVDSDSVEKYGATDIEEYTFTSLHYSIHSLDSIRSYMTSLRDRKSAEQSNVTITGNLAASVLDVADIARVKLANWQDYSSTGAINRSFEVQKVQIDWLNAQAKITLSGTTQKAEPLPLISSTVADTIDYTNWTDITTILTPGTFTDNGTTLAITGDNDLTGFETLTDNGFHYNYGQGDVTINAGTTITCTQNFILSAAVITNYGDIDTSGRGLAGFDTDDASAISDNECGAISGPDCRPNEFIISCDTKAYWSYYGHDADDEDIFRPGGTGYVYGKYIREDKTTVLSSKTVSSYTPSIVDGKLNGLPETLCGRGGLKGKPLTFVKTLERGTWGGSATMTVTLGSAAGSVAGGGGVLLICNGLYGEGIGNIITSGSDGNAGGLVTEDYWTSEDSNAVIEGSLYTGDSDDTTEDLIQYYGRDDFEINAYAMSSEGGYPGAVVVILRDSTITTPDMGTIVTSKIGATPSPGTQMTETTQFFTYDDGAEIADSTDYSGGYSTTTSELAAGYEIPAADATKVCYLYSSEGDTATASETISQYAAAVDSLTLTEALDTPETPNQNISTITATAAEPSDSNFSYAIFEYRIANSGSPFYQIPYKTPTQATVELASDGTEYEFRARSVSISGLESTSGVSATINTTLVTTSTVSEGQDDTTVPDEFKLPDVTNLQLVNTISGSTTQFKSGNAEFVWDSLASNINFKIYTVKIYRVEADNSTTLLRTVETENSNYTYTLEQNTADSCGREFQISVTATSRTGYVTTATRLQVENPEPSAPSSVVASASYSQINITFDLPTDADFVGVDAYIMTGTSGDVYQQTPTRLTGNNISLSTDSGTTYTLGLKSVDEFGAGGAITQTSITTPSVPSTDLSGLGDWAYLTEPATLEFISANIDNDSISGDKVTHLTVAKLEAGQVTVQVELGTGVLLDGANGIIQTVAASGYKATMGTHSITGISNTLIYSVTNDSNNTPIWHDINGNAKFGELLLSSDGSISSPYFNLSSTGLSLTGSVTITSGSGYSNLTDKPTSLAGINSTEGSKLSGIENGATLGATEDDLLQAYLSSQTENVGAWDGTDTFPSNTATKIYFRKNSTGSTARHLLLEARCSGNYQGFNIVGTVKHGSSSRYKSQTDINFNTTVGGSAPAHTNFYRTYGDPLNYLVITTEDDGTDAIIRVYADITANYSGILAELTVTKSNSWTVVVSSDSVSDLSAMEGTEVTPLHNRGSEDGATVGADWNGTIANIPVRFGDTATKGLNLTADYLGYYNGSTWTSYIDSDGKAYFQEAIQIGTGENYISFNGSNIIFGDNVTIGSATDRTVTVGATGDYTTLSAALEALSKVLLSYKEGGVLLKIRLQTDFIWSEVLHIDGVNLSGITIDTGGTVTVDMSSNLIVCDQGSAKIKVSNGGVLPTFYGCTFSLSGRSSSSSTYKENFINFESNSSGNLTNVTLSRSSSSTSHTGYAILADQGSKVYANNLKLSGHVNTTPILADNNATITLANSCSSDSSVYGHRGGKVYCNDMDAGNIRGSSGGTVIFAGGSLTNVISGSDLIAVADGGSIILNDVTYDSTDISQDLNTVTGNGVIYDADASDSSGTLTAGSVPIMKDGYGASDAQYTSTGDGDAFRSCMVTFAASGTVTVWLDFSGGNERDAYVKRDGTTVASWSDVDSDSKSVTISVTAGQTIWIQSDSGHDEDGSDFNLDRWQIRTTNITDMKYICVA